jgi:hypothetical protein
MARVAFRDPWSSPTLKARTCRCRSAGAEEGAILKPKQNNGLPLSANARNEDANDKAS